MRFREQVGGLRKAGPAHSPLSPDGVGFFITASFAREFVSLIWVRGVSSRAAIAE